MTPLNTLIYYHTTTDLSIIKQIVSYFDTVNATFDSDIEQVIEKMNSGNFYLLIIDNQVQSDEIKKLTKIAEILFNHAAWITFNFQDAEYMKYKMSGLLYKWTQSDEEEGFRFWDSPI